MPSSVGRGAANCPEEVGGIPAEPACRVRTLPRTQRGWPCIGCRRQAPPRPERTCAPRSRGMWCHRCFAEAEHCLDTLMRPPETSAGSPGRSIVICPQRWEEPQQSRRASVSCADRPTYPAWLAVHRLSPPGPPSQSAYARPDRAACGATGASLRQSIAWVAWRALQKYVQDSWAGPS